MVVEQGASGPELAGQCAGRRGFRRRSIAAPTRREDTASLLVQEGRETVGLVAMQGRKGEQELDLGLRFRVGHGARGSALAKRIAELA